MKKSKAKKPSVTTTSSVGATITLAADVLRRVKLRCYACGHEEMAIEGMSMSCPKCFDAWVRRSIPTMGPVAEPQAPEVSLPQPPARPKPAILAPQRYAKVFHQPSNPLFCYIRFEDDASQGKLHIKPGLSLRNLWLVVEPNKDKEQGGWTLVSTSPAYV